MRRFVRDVRGQSMLLARFILSIIVAAPLMWIFWEITDPILADARNATSATQANNATQAMMNFSDYLPMVYLLIAFFGLLVGAVFYRELRR